MATPQPKVQEDESVVEASPCGVGFRSRIYELDDDSDSEPSARGLSRMRSLDEEEVKDPNPVRVPAH